MKIDRYTGRDTIGVTVAPSLDRRHGSSTVVLWITPEFVKVWASHGFEPIRRII